LDPDPHLSKVTADKTFFNLGLFAFAELRAAGGKTEICDRGDGGIRSGVGEDNR